MESMDPELVLAFSPMPSLRSSQKKINFPPCASCSDLSRHAYPVRVKHYFYASLDLTFNNVACCYDLHHYVLLHSTITSVQPVALLPEKQEFCSKQYAPAIT